jgi:hypothetical protein
LSAHRRQPFSASTAPAAADRATAFDQRASNASTTVNKSNNRGVAPAVNKLSQRDCSSTRSGSNNRSYKQGPPARAEGRCCSSDCSARRSGTPRVTTRVVSTGHYIFYCRGSRLPPQEGIPPDSHATGRSNPAARTSTNEEVRRSDRLTIRDQPTVLRSDREYCFTVRTTRAIASTARVTNRECKHRKNNCSLPPDRTTTEPIDSHTDR